MPGKEIERKNNRANVINDFLNIIALSFSID
jgi:hypothetical protein